MQVEKWAWLIGLSEAGDARVLEWSRSLTTPPKVKAEDARLQSPCYNTERHATLLIVEKPIVSLTLQPTTPCVHPVFELHQVPKTLTRIELNGQALTAHDYARDDRTLWLNSTLCRETTLRVTFGGQSAR
jgi:hypothetical protein